MCSRVTRRRKKKTMSSEMKKKSAECSCKTTRRCLRQWVLLIINSKTSTCRSSGRVPALSLIVFYAKIKKPSQKRFTVHRCATKTISLGFLIKEKFRQSPRARTRTYLFEFAIKVTVLIAVLYYFKLRAPDVISEQRIYY